MAPKPTEGFPEWDTTQTNVLEADATHKSEGWIKPGGVGEKPLLEYFNWFMNLVYKWIIYMAEAKTVISTQAEFDDVFDGTTVSNANIYIEIAGSPYSFNNGVPFGSNLKIDSDPGVIIERAGLYTFSSTGSGGSRLENIEITDNITFDGKKATYTITTDGGVFDISHVNNSKFQMNIIDSETSGDGGAYWATVDTNDNCIIKNISGCEAYEGGGVWGVYNSKISNISSCTSSLTGNISDCLGCLIEDVSDNTGTSINSCSNSTIANVYGDSVHGISNSSNCIISNVYDNGSDGVSSCDKSKITNVYGNGNRGVSGCTSSIITNIHDNTTDGVSGSPSSDISNVYDNGVDGVSGCTGSTISDVYSNDRQGVYLCHDSTITNVSYNTTYGINNSNSCKITNIHNNSSTGVINSTGGTITHVTDNASPDANAGGCDNCDDSVFMGAFRGNTTTSGSYDHIRGGGTGIAFVIGDGTANVLVQTSRVTVNF